ncbi:hypothetical protein [Prauserella flavalba]|uniref:hypothetical protein n=1 Tax=Prauserella flavalba TaxID=1477506 RepID=UPI0036E45CD8
MDRRRSESPSSTALREPIRSPWLWVSLVLVVLAGVPFYLPTGTVEPLIGGVPYWLVVSLGATLAFSAITCWACLRAWSLAEPEEEAAAGGSDS